MKICMYGSHADKNAFMEALAELDECDMSGMEPDLYSEYDDFVCGCTEKCYDLILITADNARGMEGVYRARIMFPDKPVIWFSNDRDFGLQSYRYHVTYFHTKPITTEVVKQMMQRIKRLSETPIP